MIKSPCSLPNNYTHTSASVEFVRDVRVKPLRSTSISRRRQCAHRNFKVMGRAGHNNEKKMFTTLARSTMLRRFVLAAVGAQGLAASVKSPICPTSGLTGFFSGDGGGSFSGGGNGGGGGDGGGGWGDSLFGVSPAYARQDKKQENTGAGEGVDDYADDDIEDDFDDDDMIEDDIDDEDIDEDDETGLGSGKGQSKKPKSRDSFICESVLATNLPTGPGIPTKVSYKPFKISSDLIFS